MTVSKDLVRGYFPRYQTLWGIFRNRIMTHPSHGAMWEFHCSFVDTHHLVEVVPANERELFAANMYAHVLMAQVLHTYFAPFPYSRDERALNAFPRVRGILSTNAHHICPAVMPSMLLYWSPEMFHDGYYSSPVREREQRLWQDRSYVFDAGVKVVFGQIVGKTELLTGSDQFDYDEVRYQLIAEHLQLKSTLQKGSLDGQMINHF